MAIVLKATYSTGLTQAGLSSHRFSLSLRTKVADMTQTTDAYPIQLRSPEEEFVGWVKHRWAY